MQPRRLRLVGDADLGSDPDQGVESSGLGRAAIGGRDDANPATALAKAAQGIDDDADAAPLEEGTQQHHLVGGVDLERKFLPDARLPATVHEERTRAQGGVRPHGNAPDRAGLRDGKKFRRGGCDGPVGGDGLRMGSEDVEQGI